MNQDETGSNSEKPKRLSIVLDPVSSRLIPSHPVPILFQRFHRFTVTPFRRASTLLPEPHCRIDRRPTMTNLEMQMRRELGIGDSNAADHLTFDHGLVLLDVRTRERAID